MLANSGKHREVRTDLKPDLWTGSTVIFTWSQPEKETHEPLVTNASVLTYVTVGDKRFKAIELFEAMADQWRAFLVEEGLFEFRPGFPEDT